MHCLGRETSWKNFHWSKMAIVVTHYLLLCNKMKRTDLNFSNMTFFDAFNRLNQENFHKNINTLMYLVAIKILLVLFWCNKNRVSPLQLHHGIIVQCLPTNVCVQTYVICALSPLILIMWQIWPAFVTALLRTNTII